MIKKSARGRNEERKSLRSAVYMNAIVWGLVWCAIGVGGEWKFDF